jgi:pseudoazurin
MKSLMFMIAHIVVGLFVLWAIWPALQGDNDRYNSIEEMDVEQPAVIEEVVVETPAAPEVIEPEVTEEAEVVATIEPETSAPKVEEKTVVAQTEPEVKEAAAEPAAATASKMHIVTTNLLKYKPLVVMISPGDTVAWEKMATHDTQSLVGLIPEAAEMWHSAMGENYQRTFTHEGIYIYKCTPHFGGGMGGVIIVGKPVNLQMIKDAPVKGAAKRLVKKAIKAAEAM